MWGHDWITLSYHLLNKGWAGYRHAWPASAMPASHQELFVATGLAGRLLLLSWLIFLPALIGMGQQPSVLGLMLGSALSPASLYAPPQVHDLAHFQKAVGTTPIAHILGESGRVRLRVLVAADGQCQEVHLLESSHPAMAAAIEASLPALRFRPGRQCGRRVAMWQEVAVPFEPSP